MNATPVYLPEITYSGWRVEVSWRNEVAGPLQMRRFFLRRRALRLVDGLIRLHEGRLS